MDRSDTSTANDTLHWIVDGAQGLQITATAWTTTLGSSSQRVWQGTLADSNLVFAGKNDAGIDLASGTYLMRIAVQGTDQLWNLETPFTVQASPLSWTAGALKIEPADLILSQARVLGDSLLLSCQVQLPHGDTTRIVARSGDSVLAVIGSSQAALWSATWNGADNSGTKWFDPINSPFAGKTNSTLVIALQKRSGVQWADLGCDTLHVTDMPAKEVAAPSSIYVQGKSHDTLRVADLISDYKLRARLDGNLSYFPSRKMSFEVFPQGLQTARQYLPVDYEIEWAKYYNSIAGFQNYSGTWYAPGWYLNWMGRTRHDNQTRSFEGKEIPFWMMANAGNSGIGERDKLNVIYPNSVSATAIDKNTLIGIPPLYQPSLDTEPFSIVRNGIRLKFDPKSFFNGGKNNGFSNDPFNTTNNGYSGFHDDDPLGLVFQDNQARFASMANLDNWGWCRDSLDSIDSFSGDTVLTAYAEQPNGVDSLFEHLMVNKLTKNHPLWLLSPKEKICNESYKNFQISVSVDSAATKSDSIKWVDNSLLTVLYNMRKDSASFADTLTYQEYLDSLKVVAGNSHWSSSKNIGATFHVHRHWVGFFDDAYWMPLPQTWNQHLYVYGPGYRKSNSDTLGALLYRYSMKSNFILNSYSHSAIDKYRVDTLRTFGANRLVTAKNAMPCGRDKCKSLPGQNRWFFDYKNTLLDSYSDAGYDFSDAYEDGEIKYIPNDLYIRAQIPYTVPPRLNWMNPWFYLHDTSVTVKHLTLYVDTADSSSYSDGCHWDAVSGGVAINGQTTYGGYKEGQVGYWFKPYQGYGRVLRANVYGTPLSEVDFIRDYAHHVRPDSTDLSKYSKHNLRFYPELLVTDSTRGVVWDTVSVAWPNYRRNGTLRDHLDLITIADSSEYDSLGRTWARVAFELAPPSNWIPSAGTASVVGDTSQTKLWEYFKGLPDEYTTGQAAGLRKHALYSYVKAGSLLWALVPQDTLGRLVSDQSKLAWNLDTAQTESLYWNDIWTKKSQSETRRVPILKVVYLDVPDTLQEWSSSKDPYLSKTDGWFHMSGTISGGNGIAFAPLRTGLSLVPHVDSADSLIPCYRPWVAAAFVRTHSAGDTVCGDTVSINPNLLLSGSTAKWNIEIYYPDGQTPNVDMAPRGLATLQNVALRLSDSRSSQRWVRLQGSLADSIQDGGKRYALKYWRIYGYRNGVLTSLDLPRAQTDSQNLKLGRTHGHKGDDPWTPDQDPNLAWWNVTGLQGDASFRIMGVYASSENDTLAQWMKVPFVIGQPRDSSADTIHDAYGRASLTLPADSTGASTPIVLNTLAGDDLAKLPLNGATPIGPVIQMSPSGQTFSPAGVLRYHLTVRELLKQMGRELASDSMNISIDSFRQVKKWAEEELAVWELSDDGSLEKVPTEYSWSGDTSKVDRVQVDFSEIELIGSISHFSYALVMHKDPTKNVAPQWVLARRGKNGLRLSLDVLKARTQGANPASVEVRLSATSQVDTSRFARTTFLIPIPSSRIDTTISTVPADWTRLLDASTWAFARFDSSGVWASIQIQDSVRQATFGQVFVAPVYVSQCSDTVRLIFSSDLPGSARAQVFGPDGTVDTVLGLSVQAGTDTLLWPVCQNGVTASKGIYRTLLERIGTDGSIWSDSSTGYVLWGVDTTPPSLGAVVGPDSVIVPRSGTPVSFGSRALGWPLTTLWGARVRQVADARGAAADSVWKDVTASLDGDTLKGLWLGNAEESLASRGTWQVELSATLDGARLARRMDVLVDSEAVALSLSLDRTRIDSGSQITATLRGDGVYGWKLTLLGADSLVRWSKNGSSAGSLYEIETPLVDTLHAGAWRLCALGTGRAGAQVSICTTFAIRKSLPRLTDLWAMPKDTLWCGWPAAAMTGGVDSQWVLTGSMDRAGTLLCEVRRSGQALRTDTLKLSAGGFVWKWDGLVGAKRLSEGAVEVRVYPLGSDSATDSVASWNLWIHRVPRVFVWSGTASAGAQGIMQALVAHGVSVASGDADAAARYLMASPKGTVVLADTALPERLWNGQASGLLLPWCLNGGNAVFAGAPALSAWRDGSGTVHVADSSDVARMAIYGVSRNLGYGDRLQRSFASGIRKQSVLADSIDAFSGGFWSSSKGSSMDWTLRLRWFDSAGVSFEAGRLGHVLDSLHYTNRRDTDTVAIDTVRYGQLLYYPPQDSGLRRGGLMELPAVGDAASGQSAGNLVWAQFLVPDFGISASDIRFVYRPKGVRAATQWRPIPGDSLDVTLSLRVRDGGMDTLPDSAIVILHKIEGLWGDTQLVIKGLSVGKMTLPTFHRVIPADFPYGNATVTDSVVPMVIGSVTEPYLRNNVALVALLVGDTARPSLAWTDPTTGLLPLLQRPMAPGKDFAAHTKGWTRHGLGNWKWRWNNRLSNGGTAGVDSGETHASDTSRWEYSSEGTVGERDGSIDTLVFQAEDQFGNQDSLKAGILVDAVAPKIESLTLGGTNSGVVDTSDGVRQFASNSAEWDTLRLVLSDNHMLGSVRLFTVGGDTTFKADTLLGGPWTLKVPIQVANDASDTNAAPAHRLVVRDAAGNDSVVDLRVLKPSSPSALVARVSIPSNDDKKCYLDTLYDSAKNKNSNAISMARGAAARGRALVRIDSAWVTTAWKNSGASSGPIVVNVTRGKPIDLLFAGLASGSVVSMSATMDGKTLDTSIFKALMPAIDTALNRHPTQRLVRVTPTASRHKLVFGLLDQNNLRDSVILVLQDSLADLQVVDSAGDNNGSGADWGEVYMRRNVLTVPGGSSQPETWDYWLIQRRNPLVAGQVDDNVYRLLVDEDNDSLTGDTTSDAPSGFRGAELALEWSGLSGADDGSGAHVQLLRWNDTTKVWVAQDSSLEGLYPLKGYGFHMNELDNPTTDSVGRGDQKLPSGKVAAANGGVTEIGLRSSADKSLNPIRWAIIPWGAAGDTVRGDSGGMLVFEPQLFKPVTVDGDASDWWPNNTPVGIEVLSRTDSLGDTLGVRIEVRNPGTRTQQGLQFKYWLHCDSMPSVRLDSVPQEWKNLSVQSIVHDTSKATGTWAVTLLCGDCFLTGGADFSPAAYLRLWGGDVAKNRSDDWSNSSQASSPNPKFPAYDLQGDVLFGSEPPPRDLHLPVARISPSGTRWITVGQTVVFNADSSYDPDKAVLSYEWWHSGTGIHGTSNSDTLLAQKAGVQLVTLHVYDPAHPVRGSWATDSIYVVDSNGATGTKPVRTDSLYLFDDQWKSDWSVHWGAIGNVVTRDTLIGVDGAKHELLPTRGDSMLAIHFDQDAYYFVQGDCDGWNYVARDTIDLSKFTNLEFKVAMDAGMKQPVRIWLDRTIHGQGNEANKEEDFVYLNGYLKDASDPSHWQTVSIPLSEVVTEGERRSQGLQLKIMPDGASSGSTNPRILLDDIRLVAYKAPGQTVTTRNSGLQVLAKTSQTGTQNQLGMTVRMINQGQIPLQLDSMRMRLYYQTRQGQVRGDTIFGRDTMSLQWWGGLPIDSTMDPNQITEASLSLSAITPTYALANQYGQIQWNGATAGPDSGLRLRTTASATFWTVMQNYSSCPSATNCHATEVPMIRFNGGHSLAWSWPDSADFFQFAPHIVVDHALPGGSWCRVWGLAPGEAQATVSYCSGEDLVDPSQAVGAVSQIEAHIVVDTLAEAGSRVVASAATSSDPMGHVLQFHWLDASGRVIATGLVDTVVVPDTGKLVLRLRAFDLNDPSRTGEDSATIRPLAKAAPKDSSAILSGSGGTWGVGSAWGSGNTVPQPEWRSSVDLSAKDSSCPVRLLPVGSDSILVIPFSKDSLDGVRFDAPVAALDRSHFTNLEFWVASSREWSARNHRDAPVRIWLTQQTAPGDGDNNHANEEDFTLLQAYLGTTLKLQRHWQKVSIPLDELYQSARAANSDSTKLFLKFMLDNSFSGSVDTARRADLYLSGIRFVKYDSTASRVTTRKVGAMLTGTTKAVVNSWESRLDFRLLNTSSKALNSDSLRLWFGYWHQPNVGVSFSNNTGGQGTDESVSDQWFSVSNSTLDIPLSTDQWGRKANHVVTMAWNSAVPLAGTKGWEAIWLIGFYDSLFRNGRSLQHFNADSSLSFSLLTGITADYRKPDGSWARIWGYAPGENPDTVTYWARENVHMPADSIAPAASVVALSGSCIDTSTHSGGGTDTGSTSNTSVAAGDTAALPSTGRDAGLTVASGTAGGKTATVVSQTRSDWSVKHTFTFDTAWAHHREILVDIWVDPAQMSGSAWLGSLSLSTFDGQSWISLDPSGGADLSGSVGTWKTLHFVYDPSRYVLGRSFDLQFLANGHGSDGSIFHFAIGAIRLAGTTTDTAASGGGTPALPASSGPGISMDTLSRWSVCNACALVADGNGGSAIAVTPASGNPVMQTAITVDSAFHAGTSFHVDLFSQFPLQGWESATFVIVDEASGRYWDSRTVTLPVGVSAGWTRLEIPYDGSLYGLGTTATLKVVLNANAPSGKQIELDNLTWMH